MPGKEMSAPSEGIYFGASLIGQVEVKNESFPLLEVTKNYGGFGTTDFCVAKEGHFVKIDLKKCSQAIKVVFFPLEKQRTLSISANGLAQAA